MNFQNIRPRARVMYRDRFGQERTGRANPLLIFPTHVVLDIGGKYGTPQVVNDSNYIRHTNPKA